MAKLGKARYKISRKAGVNRAAYQESKHKRDSSGKFADKPGAGDDVPKQRTKMHSPLTDDEEWAVKSYAGTAGGAEINRELRGLVDPDLARGVNDPYSQRTIRGLDSAIEKSEIQTDIVVHRILSNKRAFEGLTEDSVLVDKGYVSTSWGSPLRTREAFVSEFPNGVFMKIEVPRGARGFETTHNKEEREIIFPRGTRLRFRGQDREGNYLFKMEL